MSRDTYPGKYCKQGLYGRQFDRGMVRMILSALIELGFIFLSV